MQQIDIDVAKMNNQEIDNFFWGHIKEIFVTEEVPNIYLLALGAEDNPTGFEYLREQIMMLGKLQQAGETEH